MKKILLFSIISVFMMSANQVIALTYKDALPTNTGTLKLSEGQRSQANILQIYVHRYQEEINNFYKSYSSKESSVMKETNILLNKMSRVLWQIQNSGVEVEYVDEIMKSIIEDLRVLNESMKVYLEQEKILHEKEIDSYKEKYILLGQKISKILDTIISELSAPLLEKDSLSEKEKNIVRNLVIIRDQNDKIKEFESQHFKSEAEIKLYFKNIVSKIRESLLNIKNYSQ